MRNKQYKSRQQINRDKLVKLANKAKRRRKLSNFIHSDLMVGLTEILQTLWALCIIWLMLVVAGCW